MNMGPETGDGGQEGEICEYAVFRCVNLWAIHKWHTDAHRKGGMDTDLREAPRLVRGETHLLAS